MAAETIERMRIMPRPEFAKILRTDDPFTNGSAGLADRVNARFDRLVLQSGTGMSPPVALRFCLLGALALGGTTFVVFENMLATAAAVAAGSLVPLGVLQLARVRRRAQLQAQLPIAIGELSRTISTGCSLPQCVELVAAETPEPLGVELRMAVRRMRMGIDASEALAELGDRTGVPGMNRLIAQFADRGATAPEPIAEQANDRRRATALDLLFPIICLVIALYLCLVVPAIADLSTRQNAVQIQPGHSATAAPDDDPDGPAESF